MSTHTEELVETPEHYRAYLHTLVRIHADRHLNGKIDLSGVVQQTLLEAKGAVQWREWRPEERTAWLRRVLAHNLTDEVRKVRACSRDVGRELSLDQVLAESSARLEAWLAAEQSSPSERAGRAEDLLRLLDALADLPEDQRRAVELHHLAGLSLADTAAAMGRPFQSVVGLIYRGLKQLRKSMT